MSADVIVIGLGAVGSATVYQLARRGVRVTGLDRFSPPHVLGSSHGDTRITRTGIGEGSVYSPIALRSHQIWRELEDATGIDLLLTCGFIAIDGSGGAAAMHGKRGFVDATIASAVQHGIAHEALSPDEAVARFPQFELNGDEQVYYEPGGGLVFPERCIAAQLQRAAVLGANIVTGEQVTAITPDAGGVQVLTQNGIYRANRVVIAAGGWTPGLTGSHLAPMKLLRQVLHWYAPERPQEYAAGRMPTFIWLHGTGAEDSFYGFPIVPGFVPGVKVAREQYSLSAASPEAIDRVVAASEEVAMYDVHVAGRLARLTPGALQSMACFYTLAPDGDFVIDTDPDADRVLIVSACSGHGFKHSAGIGAHIADVLEDRDKLIAEFALNRHALDRPSSAVV